MQFLPNEVAGIVFVGFWTCYMSLFLKGLHTTAIFASRTELSVVFSIRTENAIFQRDAVDRRIGRGPYDSQIFAATVVREVLGGASRCFGERCRSRR